MASALLELRKAAGFKKSAEFAKVVKIPASTYARYESSPDKIPMGAARQLADWFRVPIDVIVGREEVDVRALRGDVQEAYDSLSEESKLALDQFLSFLLHQDGLRRQREEAEADRRFDELAWRYERLWQQELDGRGELDDLIAFGTREERREGFEEFVTRRAEERRGRVSTKASRILDEQSIARIMQAYDRSHGRVGSGGAGMSYHPSLEGGRRVFIEFDGRGGRKGGDAGRP